MTDEEFDELLKKALIKVILEEADEAMRELQNKLEVEQ